MDEFDYKPNSNKAKEERKESLSKVVKTKVRRRKGGGLKKIANIILAEDIEDAPVARVSSRLTAMIVQIQPQQSR